MKATDAPSATAPQSAAVGVACNVLSASAVGCGFGAVDHATSIGQDLGATLAFNANEGASNGSVTVTLSGNGAAYSGAVNALSLNAGSFPNWTIAGGSTIDSATFNGSVTFAASGALTGASFTLSDAASDATVTVSAAGSPVVVTGIVKQTDTGATLATFTTDAAGNGTITYSNGTTAPIVAWHVMG